ncbi:MAG: type II toxin-antitoxin system VapC family toxin [Stellaceae bacterium]
MIVIDASAILESLLGTPAAEAVEERLFQPAQTVHAPHLLDLEIAQVLRRYASARLIEPEHCVAALQAYSDLPILRHMHAPLLLRIWELRNNFTAYDAAYVALAEALGATLVTRDRRLASAAGHHARIELM